MSDLSGVKALIFDVFGTVVDWRTSLINDFTKWGETRGIKADWTALVDGWRAVYTASMDEVRKNPQNGYQQQHHDDRDDDPVPDTHAAHGNLLRAPRRSGSVTPRPVEDFGANLGIAPPEHKQRRCHGRWKAAVEGRKVSQVRRPRGPRRSGPGPPRRPARRQRGRAAPARRRRGARLRR